MKDAGEPQRDAKPRVKSRALFHGVAYGLTMLVAIPALYLGIVRDDWDRDWRITLGIGGAGLIGGCSLVLAGIYYQLWKERRDKHG